MFLTGKLALGVVVGARALTLSGKNVKAGLFLSILYFSMLEAGILTKCCGWKDYLVYGLEYLPLVSSATAWIGSAL
jgi:hypothetical protein